MGPTELLDCAQRLQAIAQAGIAFATSAYDVERYEEVRRIGARLMQELTDGPVEEIVRSFAFETGYPTPKVDIRVVMFRGGEEILLVQEKIDHGRWTLPGGWADVGYSPFEVAAKEAEEETGLKVKPVRLLALLDKRKHAHPSEPWYVYKAFVQCEIAGGELKQATAETSGARWFRRGEVRGIELSKDRVTASQLETMFLFAADPGQPALCD